MIVSFELKGKAVVVWASRGLEVELKELTRLLVPAGKLAVLVVLTIEPEDSMISEEELICEGLDPVGGLNSGLADLVRETRSRQACPAIAPNVTSIQLESSGIRPKAAKRFAPQR